LIYAHRKTAPGSAHGIFEEDVIAFDSFLDLCWRDDGREKRPEGVGADHHPGCDGKNYDKQMSVKQPLVLPFA